MSVVCSFYLVRDRSIRLDRLYRARENFFIGRYCVVVARPPPATSPLTLFLVLSDEETCAIVLKVCPHPKLVEIRLDREKDKVRVL